GVGVARVAAVEVVRGTEQSRGAEAGDDRRKAQTRCRDDPSLAPAVDGAGLRTVEGVLARTGAAQARYTAAHTGAYDERAAVERMAALALVRGGRARGGVQKACL